MMARRWLVAAVVLLALGGCGDEPDAEPVTVPVPATSNAAPTAARTTVAASRVAAAPAPERPKAARKKTVRTKVPAGSAEFVAAVRRDMPRLAVDHRDDEVAGLAGQACAALAAGRPAAAVVAEVRAIGTDPAGARKLIRLAIDIVCPERGIRTAEF